MKVPFAFLFFLLTFSAFAQFEENYSPISFKGPIPKEFLLGIKDKIEMDVKKAETDLNEKTKKEYYTLANLSFSELLLGGHVYFNDEISAYINRVANKLLASEPALQQSVKFYVGRSSVPNAYALGGGVVVFNIGLLSRMENEAQLAFVLAHEIAHLSKKHSLLRFKKNDEAKSKSKRLKKGKLKLENNNDIESQLEALRYSREHEYEADNEGFLLLNKSQYNAQEAIKALGILSSVHLYKYDSAIDLKPVFGELKSAEVCVKKFNTEYLKENKGKTGEEWSSHPDLRKRIATLEKTGAKSEGSEYLLGESEFQRIRLLCDFEMAAKFAEGTAYAASFARNWQLLQKFPNNAFLKENIANSLVWIALFKKNKDQNKTFFENNKSYDDNLTNCVCKLEAMTEAAFFDASVKFLKKLYDEMPGSEMISINYARLLEIQEKKEQPAKPIYAEHTKRFPNGLHTPFAKKRI